MAYKITILIGITWHGIRISIIVKHGGGREMKKVYIVRGSEDGTLGAYSNFKAAYNRAVEYFTNCGIEDKPDIEVSYGVALKKLKKYTFRGVTITAKNRWFEVEIECFPLESK
jgi:hypothetical protein